MGEVPHAAPKKKKVKKAAAPNALYGDEKPLGATAIAAAVNALNEITLESLKELHKLPSPSEQVRRTVQTVAGLLYRDDMEEWPGAPSWEEAARSLAKTGDFFKRLHTYPYPRLDGRQDKIEGVLPDFSVPLIAVQEESPGAGTLFFWAQLVLGENTKAP